MPGLLTLWLLGHCPPRRRRYSLCPCALALRNPDPINFTWGAYGNGDRLACVTWLSKKAKNWRLGGATVERTFRAQGGDDRITYVHIEGYGSSGRKRPNSQVKFRITEVGLDESYVTVRLESPGDIDARVMVWTRSWKSSGMTEAIIGSTGYDRRCGSPDERSILGMTPEEFCSIRCPGAKLVTKPCCHQLGFECVYDKNFSVLEKWKGVK